MLPTTWTGRLRIAARPLLSLLVVAAVMCAWPFAAGANPLPPTITVTVSPSTLVANGHNTATITATVTQGSDRPVEGDTVTFASSDPHQTISPTSAVTDANGVATATLTSSTTVGTSNIVARDGSVSSEPTQLTQTAGPPATLTLTLSPTTLVADGMSSATATATVRDAQGHVIVDDPVTFSSSDPNQILTTSTEGPDGTYTTVIRSSTTIGQVTITASDARGLATNATLSQVSPPSDVPPPTPKPPTPPPTSQPPAPTPPPPPANISLLVSRPKVVTNEDVGIWAAVTASGVQASGTVSFYDGDAALPDCAREPIAPANPVASCRASFAAAAPRATIMARFTPAAGSSLASASASTVIDVTRDAPSVALSASPTTRAGQRTTYVAGVSSRSYPDGPIMPSGSVAFFDHGKRIPSCGAVMVQDGVSRCTITYSAIGAHTITARYLGDANFSGAVSAVRQVRVVLPPARGVIRATMQWTFRYTSTYSTILQLGISGATNATITLTCRGIGCPFVKRTIMVPTTHRCGLKLSRTCPTRGNVELVSYFLHRRLAPGTKVTVLIGRNRWVGKYYTFVIRARRGPVVAISCMAPGSKSPGVGCST